MKKLEENNEKEEEEEEEEEKEEINEVKKEEKEVVTEALAYHFRGKSFFLTGEFWKTVEDNSKAMQAGGNIIQLWEAYHDRALAFEALGKYEDARTDKKKMEFFKRQLGVKKWNQIVDVDIDFALELENKAKQKFASFLEKK